MGKHKSQQFPKYENQQCQPQYNSSKPEVIEAPQPHPFGSESCKPEQEMSLDAGTIQKYLEIFNVLQLDKEDLICCFAPTPRVFGLLSLLAMWIKGPRPEGEGAGTTWLGNYGAAVDRDNPQGQTVDGDRWLKNEPIPVHMESNLWSPELLANYWISWQEPIRRTSMYTDLDWFHCWRSNTKRDRNLDYSKKKVIFTLQWRAKAGSFPHLIRLLVPAGEPCNSGSSATDAQKIRKRSENWTRATPEYSIPAQRFEG